jgi:hypothetical protein
VKPEERAKAVIEHFAASLFSAIRPQLENVIARAITRAVNQELMRLQRRRNPRILVFGYISSALAQWFFSSCQFPSW